MCKNVKKNTREKTIRQTQKTAENQRPKRENPPWSPATMEIRVAGFRPKTNFFGSFSRFEIIGPYGFLNSYFRGRKSTDLHQHLGSTVKSMGLSSNASESPTSRPRKYTFCPTDLEIDWTGVTGPLVSINV